MEGEKEGEGREEKKAVVEEEEEEEDEEEEEEEEEEVEEEDGVRMLSFEFCSRAHKKRFRIDSLLTVKK